ncbi:MAG: hypothetical protein M3N12_04085, partial [Verrucomicrobiota bacterium]|nr:hypothetical protein [Verrucomicrobiota bacterium]
ITMVSVLEFVHEFADQPAAAASGDRIEMQSAIRAIRAEKRLGDRARKWFGTFRAERRGDPRRPALATLAEIGGPFDIPGATTQTAG